MISLRALNSIHREKKTKNPDQTVLKQKSKAQGIWNGQGVTYTPPRPTLWVGNFGPAQLSAIKKLFVNESGLFSIRTGRKVVYLDFHTITDANKTMRKFQNHKIDEKIKKGIVIDYDRASIAKRNFLYEQQRLKMIISKEKTTTLYCAACAKMCIELRLVGSKCYSDLKKRKIDGSVVINTKKLVTDIALGKGDIKKIRRIGGIEIQYRLTCKHCNVPVAYSSVPFEKSCKRVFVMKNATIESNSGLPDLSAVKKSMEDSSEEQINFPIREKKVLVDRAHKKSKGQKNLEDKTIQRTNIKKQPLQARKEEKQGHKRINKTKEKKRKNKHLKKEKENFSRLSKQIPGDTPLEKVKDPYLAVHRYNADPKTDVKCGGLYKRQKNLKI